MKPIMKETIIERMKTKNPGPTYATEVTKLGKANDVQWVPAQPVIAPPTAPAMQADIIARGVVAFTEKSAGSVTPRAADKDAWKATLRFF